MAKKRVHITYSGLVQGVGFRFTAERVAASLNITGWVMNMHNGNVEVVCEGEEADIVAFMEKIKNSLGNYIRSRRANWQEYTGEFNSFDIRFY